VPEWTGQDQLTNCADEPVSGKSKPAMTGKRDLFLLILIVGFAGLIRFIGIGQQSIWVDEAFSIKYAQIFGQLTPEYILDNLHGPLHAIILHVWAKIFGHGEGALRFPSLLISLATIPCFWLMARYRWGAAVAWTGTILLALSPFHIWYAQEARNYAFLIFFAVVCDHALARLQAEGGRPKLFIAYGAALLLGFLSNLAMIFILIPHGLGILGLRRTASESAVTKRGRWHLPVRVILTWAVVAACLSPWIVGFYKNRLVESRLDQQKPTEQQMVLRDDAAASPMIFPYTFYVFTGGYSLGPARREISLLGPWEALRRYMALVCVVGVIIASMWIGGLTAAWRRNRKWAIDLFLWQILPLVLLLLIAMNSIKVVNPRYVAIAFPAFIITLAFNCHWKRYGMVAIALVCLLFSISTVRAYTLTRYHKSDHKASAKHLQETVGPNDLVLAGGGYGPYRTYYLRDEWPLRGEERWELFDFYPPKVGPFSECFNRYVLPIWQPGQKLHTVLVRSADIDLISAELSETARLVDEKRFLGVYIMVHERRSEDQ